MKVSFAKGLGKVLNDEKAVQKKYGQLAKPLMRRLAVLRNSPTLAHVPTTKPERRHQLAADRDEQFAVDIKGQWRLIFVVDHDPIPRKNDADDSDDNGIDLTKVTAVRVTEVSDHYK